MFRLVWVFAAVLLLNGAGSAGEPVRSGIDRDGFRLSVEIALPELPPTQAAALEALALSRIAEYPAGTALSEWVAAYHGKKAHQLARLKAKMPDAAILDGWYRETHVTTTWIGGGLICLHGEHHGYNGGNHGWLEHTIQVIERDSLRLLKLDDLIAPGDQENFAHLVTDVWRQQNRLRPEDRPSLHGLFVDDLPARLPLITAAGIEVIYPPYDVGPWSTGTVRVTLTREQARPFLLRDPWAK